MVTNKSEEKLTLNVKGMHCASCVARVEKALEKNDGVKFANVNLTSGKVLVAFDSSIIDNQALIKSVTDIGFGADLSEKSDEELDHPKRVLATAVGRVDVVPPLSELDRDGRVLRAFLGGPDRDEFPLRYRAPIVRFHDTHLQVWLGHIDHARRMTYPVLRRS